MSIAQITKIIFPSTVFSFEGHVFQTYRLEGTFVLHSDDGFHSESCTG